MAATAPQYDAVARDYERLIAPRYAVVAAAILDALDLRADDAVLDIGAGTGGLARLILPRLGREGRLVLLDLSAGMLEVARERVSTDAPDAPSVELVVGDLTELPLETGAFSQVVAQFTPLQDSVPGISEAARVLRPGGRLTVAYWGPAYRELDLLNVVRARVGIDPAVPPDRAAVIDRVAAAGFGSIEIAEHRFPSIYRDAEAYLAYRAAFGRAVAVDDETWARYWAALADEVRRMAADEGRIALDWSVELLTAVRA
ncbi:MAG TPA: class I SAM-dependent methyltransferase [Candidatus Limnocylindrales bacterium]|nr:class I SAM-dependent methyltransferase [Candidatus Limnocylindrales bacterium]